MIPLSTEKEKSDEKFDCWPAVGLLICIASALFVLWLVVGWFR